MRTASATRSSLRCARELAKVLKSKVEMLEARRLAYQYERVTDEAQRIIVRADC